MRAILLPILLMIATFQLVAQSGADGEKYIVGLMPFINASSSGPNKTEELQNIVSSVLASRKSSITMVDRTKDNMIKKELETQKHESFINGFMVEQGKQLGAQHMLIGSITNIGAALSKSGGGMNPFGTAVSSTQYCPNLSISIKLVNVETGAVLHDASYAYSNREANAFVGNMTGGLICFDREEDALTNAVTAYQSQITKDVNQFLDDIYPSSFKIFKVASYDGGQYPKTVLLTGGDATITKNQVIDVMEVQLISGAGSETKLWKDKIASLRVTEIQGDLLLCKVYSGKEALAAKMNDGVTKLNLEVR